MGQVLHGSATATEAVRRATQHSQESLRARPEKGLSGRGLGDSEGLLKPLWNRDVDPSHSAAA